jgi:1,4-alpha-glucan branching enzyme
MTNETHHTFASEAELEAFASGTHHEAWRMLGARRGVLDGVNGVYFGVWAPSARGVSVVGDFNGWDRRRHPLTGRGHFGVYEGFVAEAQLGDRYKFSIETAGGEIVERADPFAKRTEVPPRTASVIADSIALAPPAPSGNAEWPGEDALSIYEVHLGSIEPSWGTDTYKNAGPVLIERVRELGFTHVEFMPVTEHPYGGSWGYQSTSYFAPTARWGTPEEFAHLVWQLHEEGIGVILDWVPGHFALDAHGLYRFDGSALFEHLDPRQGLHEEWGTAVFNFERNEVRSFLLSSAKYWLTTFGIDALRVDAVSSMLYLDYSRTDWVPNALGGRENLGAMRFLRELCEQVPMWRHGAFVVAEESTAFPGITKPTYEGGLGFGFKWNMGWMHDTLEYFSHEPVHRRWHHHQLTFSMFYAYTEHFILPLSHDEVVHGKGSLYAKMPGDDWQKRANVRALLGWMWGHPGKKLLFMGGEFAQRHEWGDDQSLLLTEHHTEGATAMKRLVGDLNRLYREIDALHVGDLYGEGFRWVEADDAEANVAVFLRRHPFDPSAPSVIVAANLSPVPRNGYRIAVPRGGSWIEVLNTDSVWYGGSGVGNLGQVVSVLTQSGDGSFELYCTLPPLGVLYLVPA